MFRNSTGSGLSNGLALGLFAVAYLAIVTLLVAPSGWLTDHVRPAGGITSQSFVAAPKP